MGTEEVGSVATVVRRVSIAVCVALGLGCTLTPGHGMGGAFAEEGGGETGSADDPAADGSSGSSDEDEDTSGGGDEGGGTTAGTFDPIDGSSSSGDGGGSSGEASTGAPADTSDDPGGAYAPCDTNDDCGDDPGLACLHADENGAGGFCSPSCGTYGATPPDASLCPDTPAGVTASVVCIEGLIRSCALSCQDDADCPTGTGCLPANGGGGPFCFGL